MIDYADYDKTLDPPDDPCEECSSVEHVTRNCPTRWMQKAIEEAEERYREKYKK